MKVQLKILYGPNYERCKTTVVPKEKFSSMTYELSNTVYEVVGGFFDEEERTYRDDEGTYVTMNKQSDVLVAVQSSAPIPQNDEILRVCLRVGNDFTPTSQYREAPAKKRQCTLRTRTSESKRQLNYPKRVAPAHPDLLDLLEYEPIRPKAMGKPSCIDSYNNPGFETPLQRLAKENESDLENKREKLRELQAEDEATQNKLSRVKSTANDGNMCSDCHLRIGHTARSCTYGKCMSVFSCGEERFHPGELNTKQTRSNINKIKNEIIGLERSITQQQDACDQMKQSFVNKIEQSLLQEDEAKYVSNGHKNWPLIRRHVYLIEGDCKKKRQNPPKTQNPPWTKDKQVLLLASNKRSRREEILQSKFSKGVVLISHFDHLIVKQNLQNLLFTDVPLAMKLDKMNSLIWSSSKVCLPLPVVTVPNRL